MILQTQLEPPPIAPASLGLENLAIIKIIAVTVAEARLLMMMSIIIMIISMVVGDTRFELVTSSMSTTRSNQLS